jgi:hypothetical protein
MNIDIDLLRIQIAFLDSYPWRDSMPIEVEGVINLLDAILDYEIDKKGIQ